MKPHDLILLATDGVWDNLFEREIRTLINITVPQPSPSYQWLETEVTHLAKTIASEAQTTAESPTKTTPFAQAAAQAGFSFVGGKLDDISVVVAAISN